MRDADRQFSGKEFNELCKLKFVYAWYRDGVCLYVGQTRRGLARFGKHHVIGKKGDIYPKDQFKFWFCNSLVELLDLEARLVRNIQPVLNWKQHTGANRPPKRPQLKTKLSTSKYYRGRIDISEFN